MMEAIVDDTLKRIVIDRQREDEGTDINLLHRDKALENVIKIEIEMITITQTGTKTDQGTQETTEIDTVTHETGTMISAQPEKNQRNEDKNEIQPR